MANEIINKVKKPWSIIMPDKQAIQKFCKEMFKNEDWMDRYQDVKIDTTDKEHPTILLSINDDAVGLGLIK